MNHASLLRGARSAPRGNLTKLYCPHGSIGSVEALSCEGYPRFKSIFVMLSHAKVAAHL